MDITLTAEHLALIIPATPVAISIFNLGRKVGALTETIKTLGEDVKQERAERTAADANLRAELLENDRRISERVRAIETGEVR